MFGKNRRRHTQIQIEIGLLLATLTLGVMWALEPSGNYEPIIVMCGAILAVMELARRHEQKKRDSEAEVFTEVAELLKERKALKYGNHSRQSLNIDLGPKPDENEVKFREFFRPKSATLIHTSVASLLFAHGYAMIGQLSPNQPPLTFPAL